MSRIGSEADVRAMGAETVAPVENRVSAAIIGAAIEVQRHLGSGLVESAYEVALSHGLALREIRHRRQVPLAVSYKTLQIPDAFRLDLLVEERVVVEVKAVEKLVAVHEAQLFTYLKFSGARLGLLINFHAAPLKSGIRRVANKL